MASKGRFPGDPVGKASASGKVYEGRYTDASSSEEWRDDVLAKSKLVQPTEKTGWRATLSGNQEQPKFTDFSGGTTGKYNKRMTPFQSDPNFYPESKSTKTLAKGFKSRENDWRGDK